MRVLSALSTAKNKKWGVAMWPKLGPERIGLLGIKAPWLTLALITVVSLITAFGVTRINVDDSLTELFRNDSEEFHRYERLTARFPSSEYDVLIVVEDGKTKLLTPEGIETLRELILELQFVDAVSGMVSIFSAREPPNASGVPPALIPADLPTGAAFDALAQRILTNEIVGGKLISKDGKLALVVLSLDRKKAEAEGLKKAIGEIQRVVDDIIGPSGLKAKLSGAPVMQLEIRNAVQRDRIIYNGLGFLLGAVISLIFFHRLSFMIMAAAAPALAILWSLGMLGLLDYRLNLFLNVITPLIMVISFSDSMHMVFHIRRRLLMGDDRFAAARHALTEVGPACVLTSLTTALAVLSLIFTDSALIRTFATVAALSSLIAFLAVILSVPLLTVLLLRNETKARKHLKAHDAAMDALRRLSRHIATLARRYATTITTAGILLVFVTGAAFFSLEPRYRLADQVPDREQAIAASERLDKKLTGANPIHVMIEWKGNHTLYSPETLEVVAKVHKAVEDQAGIGNVWSLEMLRRWLVEAGQPGLDVLKKYVGLLPKHLTRRFITDQQDALVVTGRMPDLDASEILPVVERIDRRLDAVRAAHPDYIISVTGLSAIAARNSASMIHQLSYGLLSTIAIVIFLMGVVFRSVRAALVSIFPNLLPIFSAGALLYLGGEGLQFASVVALTVAFGLAVDNTVHLLHRLKLEEQTPDDPVDPISRTVHIIGPVLILTTIVLAFGLAVTIFSGLPSLRLFGRLCGITLVAALIGAIFILPANLHMGRRWRMARWVREETAS